ncbi:MAG: alpha/beta hydrolase family protein [Streptosporangiaceae bacterium]
MAIGAVLAGCSGGSAASGAGSSAPSPAVTGSSSAAPHPSATARPAGPVIGVIGHYAVGRLRLSLVDQDRIGPAGSRLGARPLPTIVRYPAIRPAAGQGGPARPAAGPFPLVVFAPGFIQCDSVYAHLLHAWASAGYVVAAVTFPRTNCQIPPADADELDLSNQPGDVSFVISRLLARSARASGPLAGVISPREIAVAGHSDGADTVAALAANTCCMDHRVRAAVVLAGAEWPPLGGRYFPPGSPPMLFVQGSADTINPPPASLQLYQADTTGIRYYLDVFGASHLTPYEGSNPQERLVAGVTVAFLNRYVMGQQTARAAMSQRANVPGVAHLYSKGRPPPS